MAAARGRISGEFFVSKRETIPPCLGTDSARVPACGGAGPHGEPGIHCLRGASSWNVRSLSGRRRCRPAYGLNLSKPVKLAFATGSDDLIPGFLAEMSGLYPDVELMVVSEFAPAADYKWIPYIPKRPFALNEARIKAAIAGRPVILAGIILQPNMPYWNMRLTAWKNWPLRVVAFNDSMDHWMVRPRSFPTIARHLLWRLRNLVVSQSRPGSGTYTLFWRLAHPWAFKRPLDTMAAKTAGAIVQLLKLMQGDAVDPPLQIFPTGVSVVIPSHNGQHLLKTLLPSLMPQISKSDEVIVVDNGSSDGTEQWLRDTYPSVTLIIEAKPLGFARSSNIGIAAAKYSHLLMLNNDMVVEPNFVAALRGGFDKVPQLFGATAQIFFPEGARREETGKAFRVPPNELSLDGFPVRCDLPIEGEDGSYVYYGSGGCTLYDTAKLKALGGFGEQFAPAYVEDLDLGFRAWQRGWPTIFAANARLLHFHRQTSSKMFQPEEIDLLVQRNYLRFIACTPSSLEFPQLWGEAINRLNHQAARMEPVKAASLALAEAWRAPFWTKPTRKGLPFLDLVSGQVAVFPGKAPSGKPRILVASPYMPFPLAHGGAVRMFNLMRAAAPNFDQILVVFVHELAQPPIELLELFIEIVVVKRVGTHLIPFNNRPQVVEEFSSPAFSQALQQTVRKWQPAVAQLEFTQMAQYAKDCLPAKSILVEHDVTLDLYQQLLQENEDWESRLQWNMWVNFETAAWREVDAVVVMSEKDLLTVGTAKTVPIRNGVDLDRFRPSMEEPNPFRLLFIGSFGHLPNVMAIEFFLREVWPHLADLHPQLHIIAGSRYQYFLDLYRDRVHVDLTAPGIEVEDFVSDVRPAYRKAAVVIAPLVASAGTNIKIMEAMAMAKAVVATPAGVNGLELSLGKDVLVASGGQEMAQAIRDLLRDPAKRKAMELSARQTVERDYSWDKIAEVQRKLYEKFSLPKPDASQH